MTSTATVPEEAMVTLKVNYDGTTRKCKLPLRDMGAGTLESKLRLFLDIPPSQLCLFERFSDSAGSYVELDPGNTSVWKQLYRAAKAKSKLKLRVIDQNEQVKNELETTIHSLKAASIEDVKSSTDAGIQDITKPSKGIASLATAHPLSACVSSTLTVCCNSCDRSIPNAHYHCSTCDDGDFDLCQDCVNQGITCFGPDHWLIKRSTKNGQIIYSFTETIAPKSQSKAIVAQKEFESLMTPAEPVLVETSAPKTLDRVVPIVSSYTASTPCNRGIRTCNCCVQDFAEQNFVHCIECEDYDLCKDCFMRDVHGHHPKHSFLPAVETAIIPDHIAVKMAPGRNVLHHAICDGCDKFISGVRHKCLDCPDWDYCTDCMANAPLIHTKHRFVPVYEPLADIHSVAGRAVHYGICCDGPLCTAQLERTPSYIAGVRYKCAVCHDTDFCAACEASPNNTHNKTHPLIKFKTPVRHVSVTTHGENEDGRMQPMGDRHMRNSVTRTVVEPAHPSRIPMNTAQTVDDVKPTLAQTPECEAPQAVSEIQIDSKADQTQAEQLEVEKQPEVKEELNHGNEGQQELAAVYVGDTIADGTEFPPNHVFEQTWLLKNISGRHWPAGCSVKFVGGDYMGHVDSNRPAGIPELVLASESTICHAPLASGHEFPFTVLLRTPPREGKFTSYWRLSTKDGQKFGDRLWCEILVQAAKSVDLPQKETVVLPISETADAVEKSTMVFPKLEAESPQSSIHGTVPKLDPLAQEPDTDDFEECDDLDEWDASEDGFQTDEEYDILDTSDEEFLEEQAKKTQK